MCYNKQTYVEYNHNAHVSDTKKTEFSAAVCQDSPAEERNICMNTKTLLYILKRLLLAALTVWIVITITFFVTRAVPGGPFLGEKALSEQATAALNAKYGLDKPVFEQYTTYLSDVVFRLDFGPSLKDRGRDVIDIIADGMKVSVKLGLIAAAIATVTGVVLGAVAALRRNKIIDKVIMVITTAFVSTPGQTEAAKAYP